MTKFADTDAGITFVASASSRETSPEIMEAIAFFADNISEAEELWNGDGFGRICHPTDLWENVTNNGLRDPRGFCWGAAGREWWQAIDPQAGEIRKYRISNRITSVVLGEYDGKTEQDALDAMARDAGYADYAAAQEVAPSEDGEILVEIVR